MTRFKKELFYSADQWVRETKPELLEDGELYWLCNELKLARDALEKKLEEVL